jgi:hypothetical protein
MKIKKIIIPFVIIAVLFFMPSILRAQPPTPDNLCPDPKDPDCPLDSGTILLMATAIGIAGIKAFKFRDQSKKAIV